MLTELKEQGTLSGELWEILVLLPAIIDYDILNINTMW